MISSNKELRGKRLANSPITRERKVKNIIEQVEPELFEKVTGLDHFHQLVDAQVFDAL